MELDEKYRELLEQYTTDKFYPEYMGFLVNHNTHLIVALHRLNANVSLAQAFLDLHERERLESPQRHGYNDDLGFTYDGISLIGKGQRFYSIRKYYENLLLNDYNHNIDLLIRGECLKMVDGLFALALHGIIQIGYGYSGDLNLAVCEGLAHLHMRYFPMVTPPDFDRSYLTKFGKGQLDPFQVLQKVREDKSFYSFLKKEKEKDEDKWEENIKTIGSFSVISHTLLQQKGDELLRFAYQIKLPEWYELTDDSSSPELGKRIVSWFLDVAIQVYALATNTNDFFLLHFVTGSWSLLQVIHTFDKHRDVIRIATVYLAHFIAGYIAQGCPDFNHDPIKKYDLDAITWDDIIRQALEKEYSYDDYTLNHEHVYKLVQCCRDASLMDGASAEQIKMNKLAALMSIDNGFTYAKGS